MLSLDLTTKPSHAFSRVLKIMTEHLSYVKKVPSVK